MAEQTRQGQRNDALSRARIVEAATEFLDTAGEAGLTFRALAAKLATGPGAIYWHVANKDELVAAATDAVLGGALTLDARPRTPEAAVRDVCLRLFDAIDEHPWVSPQLARNPWQPVMLRIFEQIGQRFEVLGIRRGDWFAVASALVSYTLGVGAQNAANARYSASLGDRSRVLDGVATTWEQLEPAEYPFLRAIAPQMRDHDDREQFVAGIDFILAGARAVRRLGPDHSRDAAEL